jgi:AraC-like DNA-binding protein
LRDLVQYYFFCDFVAAAGAAHPFAVSLFPALSFFLGARCEAFEYANSQTRLLPSAGVVGPCDRRVADLRPQGRHTNFTVVFQPTGFFRLFRTSPSEIRNTTLDARDVLDARVASLDERLREQAHVEDMAACADAVLLPVLVAALPESPLRHAAAMLLEPSAVAEKIAAAEFGLSDRSRRRHFNEQIGIAPKRYARMIRFRRAVDLKLTFPHRPWSRVCAEAGYYDQAHLIAEFREFSDCAPSGFLRELETPPKSVVVAFYQNA